jgi:hypothetical protein
MLRMIAGGQKSAHTTHASPGEIPELLVVYASIRSIAPITAPIKRGQRPFQIFFVNPGCEAPTKIHGLGPELFNKLLLL